ncbi:MAG: CoA ester lyase [Candidatus Nanopelagicaceae bacterium]|nr:CoA ester lyase [Candidatus Nanopelagicaceae bacterium]
MIHSRRSVLAVPGNSEKMIGKALDFQVDQIFLDLEDAVAPESKSAARTLISSTLNHRFEKTKKFVPKIVSVRINGLGTPWIEEDLALLADGAARGVDTLVFPKASDSHDLVWLDNELSKIEKECGLLHGMIKVDAQIESAKGLINVESIAISPRVVSLAFGPADYMADMGMPSRSIESRPDGYDLADAFHYPMMKILVAARAAGIAAIDGPTLEVHDLDKFRASARRAWALGFDGKWILHPSQVEPCHEVFTPSQEQFDSVMCLLEAYEYYTSSEGGARGAVIYDGAMIDEASRKMALVIAARGESAGLKQGKHFEKG